MTLSARRIWLVAQRDYLGYIKTWGFWLSFTMPILFGLIGFFLAQSDVDFQTTRYETVLDTSGQGVAEAIEARWRAQQAEMLEAIPESLREEAEGQLEERANLIFVDPPADTLDGLLPYLRGDREVERDGESVPLDGALIVTAAGEDVSARYFSRNVNAFELPGLARGVLRDRAGSKYLEPAGLTLEGLREAGEIEPIETFDPTRMSDEGEGEAVGFTERLPYFIAAGLSLFLWFTVFSGAYMLLTSMLEEKMGKLMEMMLASTQFIEILLGKLLGVALLTLTALAPYILLGGLLLFTALTMGDPEVVAGVREAITLKMLIFFPVFLVLGYIFYGSLFIALGSMSESMQDAQTLTIPIMIVLTACVLVVPAGLNNPDAPLVVLASWIPLSAPFAAIVRLPADPSWLELFAQAGLLFVSTLAVGWLAARIFRHGVLSGASAKAVVDWFKRVVLRRRPAVGDVS